MYKVLQNNKVIDVLEVPHFVRFLPNNRVAFTDISSAQGITGTNGKLYSFNEKDRPDLTVVTVEKISEGEFNRLKMLLGSQSESLADKQLIKSKNDLITKLSEICSSKIIMGFFVRLSDGNIYNFKLTAEDQLNLLSIENQLNTGAEFFVYHATNEPCRKYSKEDMIKIIAGYRHHITYHTTYFNVCKQYINSLTDIEQLDTFNYGEDITGVVADDDIRQILIKGESL